MLVYSEPGPIRISSACRDRFEHFGKRTDAARPQAQAANFLAAFVRCAFRPSTIFPFVITRFQRNILQRGRENSSANRQHFAAHAHGLGKISGHMAERGKKQIPEAVSSQSAARMKTVLKQPPQQRLVLRKRNHAVANIARAEERGIRAAAAPNFRHRR